MTNTNRNYYKQLDSLNINGIDYVRQAVFFNTVKIKGNDHLYYKFKDRFRDRFLKIGVDIFVPTDTYREMVVAWPDYLNEYKKNKYNRLSKPIITNKKTNADRIELLEKKFDKLINILLEKKGE